MKWYFRIIALCFFWGCANSNSEKRILPEEQMTKVLWDIMQMDELATIRLAKDSAKNAKKERILLYEKVFKLHKISEKQFANSFTYYSGHPDLMKILFDTLEARGTRERTTIYLRKDSVAR